MNYELCQYVWIIVWLYYTHMWLCCLLPSLLVSQSHFLPLKMRETEHKRVIDSLCCETLHIGAFSPTRIVRVVTDKLQETQSSALSKNNCRQWSLLEKVSWHDLLQAPTVCLCLYPDWQARDWGKTFYFHGLVLPCRNEEKHVWCWKWVWCKWKIFVSFILLSFTCNCSLVEALFQINAS